MGSRKIIVEYRYDKRIHSFIKMKFASFKYKLLNDKYQAEFLEGLNPPLPLYDDVECVTENGKYIKCKREGKDEFYSWFVPAKEKNMPLFVVIPGYEARLRTYPDVSDEYNMLFISPLGYSTPNGLDIGKAYCLGTTWPLIRNTLCGFEGGYSDWLADALTVIKFIEDESLADTDKLIFAGTSNGGAMALILASYFGKDKCIATCADLPFLIGYSTRRLNDVIYEFPPPPDIIFKPSKAKKRMAIVDPEWHTSRLKMPVLLTSSDIDKDCPQEDITALFHKIPETTAKTYIKYIGREHGYSSEFFDDMMDFLGKLKEQGLLNNQPN